MCNSGNKNLRQLWISGENTDESDLQDLRKPCHYFGIEEIRNRNIYHRIWKTKEHQSLKVSK